MIFLKSLFIYDVKQTRGYVNAKNAMEHGRSNRVSYFDFAVNQLSASTILRHKNTGKLAITIF